MSDCKDYGFMTRALHAGWDCDPATGALGLPVYATAAYQFRDGAHAERLFNLEEEGFTYSRIANPTVKAFEDTLASLEGGVGAVALASGQAALSHIAATLCEAGTNVVVSRKVYGGTLTFLQNLLTRFGVEVILVDGRFSPRLSGLLSSTSRRWRRFRASRAVRACRSSWTTPSRRRRYAARSSGARISSSIRLRSIFPASATSWAER